MCKGLASIDGWGDGDADGDKEGVQKEEEVDDEARASLLRVFEPAEWYTGALRTLVSWVWVNRVGGDMSMMLKRSLGGMKERGT